MLDEIMNMVKEATGQAVNNNSQVSNNQADAIAQHVSGSLMDELKSAVSGGGLQSIMGMFSGQSSDAANHPVTQNIVSNIASSLSQKFGLSQGVASSLTSSIIPSVMSKITGKANDPNDSSINLDSIKDMLTGSGGSILDKLKGLFA
jgi:uncharacterized protein YidB (DUF937 family)